MQIDNDLTVSQNYISGWNYRNMRVSSLVSKMNTNFNIQMYNFNGQRLSANDRMGSGSKIRLIDDAGAVRAQYEVVLYGDVNGDGNIDSIDLLILLRHVLEIETIGGVFYRAGNTLKNGMAPSSVDLMVLIRHILEIESIVQ